jgi:hypothetical protein
MYVACWHNLLIQFVPGGLVQVYSSISHSDSLVVVPSFYFYVRAVEWGKGRWL